MIDVNNIPSLPSAGRLSKQAQYRYLALGAVALVVIAVLIVIARTWLTPTAKPDLAMPQGVFKPSSEQMAGLTVATVGGAGANDQIIASGTIAADDTRGTPVFMPYGGQVTQVYVDAGAAVSRGQPLLKIRTPDVVDARNTLFAAVAGQRTAAGALRIAEENAHRQEEIYKTAGGAYKDYRQAQSDLVAAQSASRIAQSTLGAARDKLAIFGKSSGEIAALEGAHQIAGIHVETTLRAPVGGTVATRAVSPGQFVTANSTPPAFTITDPTHVWLIAQLTEGDAALVHLGDAVDVTTTALTGRVFHAKIDNVAAALDPTTHRLPVRASIENPDRALKPQMFASFIINRAAVDPNTLTVPSSAVIHEGDVARVWVVQRDTTLRARNVKVGESAGGSVKIVGGLRRGERIVTAGALFVNEAGTQQ